MSEQGVLAFELGFDRLAHHTDPAGRFDSRGAARRLPGRDASLPNIVAEKLVAGSNPTIAELAYVRSGEKGEMINIGVIARSPEFLPILRSALSPKALRDHLSDLGNFEVTIYELPGIHALNIVLAGALPGGLNASQRLDPAAKSIGQRLTSLRVPL